MTKEKLRVGGPIPKLPRDRIPLADKYVLVLPIFEEVKPVQKTEPSPLESTREKEPKAVRYPFKCPDCGEMTQWTNGKRIWCSQSHK